MKRPVFCDQALAISQFYGLRSTKAFSMRLCFVLTLANQVYLTFDGTILPKEEHLKDVHRSPTGLTAKAAGSAPCFKRNRDR